MVSTERKQGSVKKRLIPGLGQGTDTVSPEQCRRQQGDQQTPRVGQEDSDANLKRLQRARGGMF